MLHRTVSATVAVLGLSLAQGVAPPARAADVYKVDTVHSTVIFRIKHNNVNYFQGRLNDLSGTLTIDEQNPAASVLDMKVSSDSIDTGNPKRDQHVKGPDFLNVKLFPAITFKSTQVSKSASGSYDLTGNLTLHGVTKPVSVKLEQTGASAGQRGGTLAGFEATFTIKRTDFGISQFPQMLGEDVRLTVNIEASRS
jgi:polyisoprenoid-binding protein YceI